MANEMFASNRGKNDMSEIKLNFHHKKKMLTLQIKPFKIYLVLCILYGFIY